MFSLSFKTRHLLFPKFLSFFLSFSNYSVREKSSLHREHRQKHSDGFRTAQHLLASLRAFGIDIAYNWLEAGVRCKRATLLIWKFNCNKAKQECLILSQSLVEAIPRFAKGANLLRRSTWTRVSLVTFIHNEHPSNGKVRLMAAMCPDNGDGDRRAKCTEYMTLILRVAIEIWPYIYPKTLDTIVLTILPSSAVHTFSFIFNQDIQEVLLQVQRDPTALWYVLVGSTFPHFWIASDLFFNSTIQKYHDKNIRLSD